MRRKQIYLTKEHLEMLLVCREAMARFRRLYWKRAEVTAENVMKWRRSCYWLQDHHQLISRLLGLSNEVLRQATYYLRSTGEIPTHFGDVAIMPDSALARYYCAKAITAYQVDRYTEALRQIIAVLVETCVL